MSGATARSSFGYFPSYTGLELNGIKDIKIATQPVNDEVLAYEDGAWTNKNMGSGASGSLLNVQVFDASGTYVPTAGTRSVEVSMWGGGGSGGGVNAVTANDYSIGSPGGNGAFIRGWFLVPDAVGCPITVGAEQATFLTPDGQDGNGSSLSWGSISMSADGGTAGYNLTVDKTTMTGPQYRVGDAFGASYGSSAGVVVIESQQGSTTGRAVVHPNGAYEITRLANETTNRTVSVVTANGPEDFNANTMPQYGIGLGGFGSADTTGGGNNLGPGQKGARGRVVIKEFS